MKRLITVAALAVALVAPGGRCKSSSVGLSPGTVSTAECRRMDRWHSPSPDLTMNSHTTSWPPDHATRFKRSRRHLTLSRSAGQVAPDS